MVRKAQGVLSSRLRFQLESSEGFVGGRQPARELVTDVSPETQHGNSCQFSKPPLV